MAARKRKAKKAIDPARAARGRSSRKKGHDWEREFRRAAEAAGIPAVRQLQSRGATEEGDDVVLGATREAGVIKREPYSVDVELKCRKQIPGAEIARLVKEGRPVAVKVTNAGKFVALDPEDFFTLVSIARQRAIFGHLGGEPA